jgi:transcriptional regulator with XRE-family HTH domain
MYVRARSTNSIRLGEFLRTRRARLSPAEFGFIELGRRLKPGLRREEVAQLTGISITYYTWIEQGRKLNLSGDILSALARTMKLSNAEQTHLFTLAGVEVSEYVAARHEPIHPTIARLFGDSTGVCAIKYDAWFNVVAITSLASALFGIETGDDLTANLLYVLFADPAQRRLWEDWDGEARMWVGMFRQALAKRSQDQKGKELLDTMLALPNFVPLWNAYDVRLQTCPDEYFRAEPWRLRHPTLGPLRIHRIAMAIPTRESRTLVLYSAADAETQARFTAASS